MLTELMLFTENKVKAAFVNLYDIANYNDINISEKQNF